MLRQVLRVGHVLAQQLPTSPVAPNGLGAPGTDKITQLLELGGFVLMSVLFAAGMVAIGKYVWARKTGHYSQGGEAAGGISAVVLGAAAFALLIPMVWFFYNLFSK